MSQKEPRVPKYPARPHQSGQARIRCAGRDVYLGVHGSPESHAEYRRVIAEYLAAGGHALPRRGEPLTVAELVAAYWSYCKGYYVTDGEPTTELKVIRPALNYLKKLYGETKAVDFGPRALQAVRQSMVDAGLTRHSVNQYVARVKSCFRWGVEQELIPGSVWQALRAVRGLRAGRTAAPDRPPIPPAPPADVAAALARMKDPPRTMVLLQQLSGMRPGEVCRLAAEQVDRSKEPWEYRPTKFKSKHHGKGRWIFFGPKCRELLTPFLTREAGLLFRTKSGRQYLVDDYRKAIHAGCDRAGVPRFAPNRLRKAAATEARRLGGLEAARQFLGHEHQSTTEAHYATPDLDLARLVAEEIG